MRNRFSSLQRLCAILMTALILLCCAPASVAEQKPLSIVTTVFPAYDFARQLAGDSANVTLLLPPGSESHSFEPTPQDVIAIQNADLFIYVGGESDAWIRSILSSMGDMRPAEFRLMDSVTAVAEELSQSMQAEHDEHEHEQEAEYDEHVWTSPKNAMVIASALCDTLCALAPDTADIFAARLTAYLAQLKELDDAFTDVVANGKRDVIVFGDRFPFRYFVEAYGLRYDAAFPGCSEDSEPSVKTVMSLIQQIREQNVPVIFYIEFSSRKTADTLAAETGAKELLFHSCHNVSADELASGATYVSLMWQNVQALREALD